MTDVVFLDVGGPIYDDAVYARALLAALRELGGDAPDEAFWLEYERCRRAQAGFTRPLAEHFLGPGADLREVAARAARGWRYPPSALHDDVLPMLDQLAGRCRIGVLANQPQATREALERDGVAPYVDLWILSEEVGLSKPDQRFFAHALRVAGCAPERAALVGNRLDNDVRPARAAGLWTVWLLRGEAPPEPTAAQLAEADVVIRTLAALSGALERLAPATAN